MSIETKENCESLCRKQLLDKLHKVNFCAFLTALTSEMCLEVEIMTSKGTSYSWIRYDDWRIYHISKRESAKLVEVREKLLTGNLTRADIKGTCFSGLADNEADDVDLTYLFIDFLTKQIYPGEELFCFYDECDEKYFFFSNKEQIASALEKTYSNVDTEWGSMETDDLAAWLDRYEFEGGEIPFCYIGDDE